MSCSRIWYQTLFFVFIISLFSSCYQTRKSTDSSEVEWASKKFSFIPSGHEVLTMYSVFYANQRLAPSMQYPPVEFNDNAYSRKHWIVIGNFAMDFPIRVEELPYTREDLNLVTVFGEAPIPKKLSDDEWGVHSILQNLHFMRTFEQLDQGGAFRACKESKDKIELAVQNALNYWAKSFVSEKEKNQHLAYFWTGLALHSIQDSFAPPHAKRRQDESRTITDICVYDMELDGICNHTTKDLSDLVFGFKGLALRSWEILLYHLSVDPDPKESFSLLKQEAQDAVTASSTFLIMMAYAFADIEKESNITTANINDGTALAHAKRDLRNFFETVDGHGSGWFHCQQLDSSL